MRGQLFIYFSLLPFIIPFATISARAADLLCLGDSLELGKKTNVPFIQAGFSFPGDSKLTLGWFLVDTGSNISSLDFSTALAGPDGKRPSASELNFFEPMPFPAYVWSDFSSFNYRFTETGIIGTNVLANQVYAFDFKKRKLFRSSFENTCTDEELIAEGFSPLSTKGYYSTLYTWDKLYPQSDPHTTHAEIQTDDANSFTSEQRTNIPTIPVKIGETSTVAEIDTGFDDPYYFSVEINTALFNLINQKSAQLIRATDIQDIIIETCVHNFPMKLAAYRLQSGGSFSWISRDGSVARNYNNAVFFLEETPPEAQACGGIGTSPNPSALVGISFLRDMEKIIFNGKTGTVWVPHD
jgi:hypothetical protein